MLLASAAPHKEEVNNITNYLVHQIKKLGVKAELGVSVTPRTVKAMRPDALIVATGGRPLVPNIPGIHRENVVTAWDILTGKVEVGDKVVVAGGGMIGCEAAESLAEKGREVVIVEMLDDIATDMPVRSKLLLAERLSRQGVKVLTNTEMVEVSERSVDLIDGKGRKHRHKTDTGGCLP